MDLTESLELVILVLVSIEVVELAFHIYKMRGYEKRIDHHLEKMESHITKMDSHITRMDKHLEELEDSMTALDQSSGKQQEADK